MPSFAMWLFDMGPLKPMMGFAVLVVVIIVCCFMLPFDTRGMDLDKKVKAKTETDKYYELVEK